MLISLQRDNLVKIAKRKTFISVLTRLIRVMFIWNMQSICWNWSKKSIFTRVYLIFYPTHSDKLNLTVTPLHYIRILKRKFCVSCKNKQKSLLSELIYSESSRWCTSEYWWCLWCSFWWHSTEHKEKNQIDKRALIRCEFGMGIVWRLWHYILRWYP